MLIVLAMAVAGMLALAGAGDLVFARHERSTLRRVCSWAALVLLIGSMGLVFGLPGSAPGRAFLFVLASAVASFFCALFTGGRFRWIIATAAVVWVIAILPIVAFFSSGQGVR